MTTEELTQQVKDLDRLYCEMDTATERLLARTTPETIQAHKLACERYIAAKQQADAAMAAWEQEREGAEAR